MRYSDAQIRYLAFVVFGEDLPRAVDVLAATRPIVVLPDAGDPAPRVQPLTLRELQRAAIVAALEHTEGDQAAAAAHLGLTPRSLNYKMQRLGIPRKRKG